MFAWLYNTLYIPPVIVTLRACAIDVERDMLIPEDCPAPSVNEYVNDPKLTVTSMNRGDYQFCSVPCFDLTHHHHQW